MAWARMGIVKQAGLIVWLIGIATVIGLIMWSGIDAVGHAVASVGWGIALVVLVRVATVSLAGAGWWLLFAPVRRPSLQACVLLRFVREGVNVLLPAAQIGGDLIGARLLAMRGVAGSLAAASVIVDVLLQATTQFLFACLGLAILVALDAGDTLAHTAAVALGVAALMLIGFYLAQRQAGQRILRWALSRLTGDRKWRVLGTIDAVYEALAAFYSARRRLVASVVVHLAGWLVGAAEVLVVFACMGNPIGVAEALVIESLLHAVRGAAFAIPGALGAQEGGLVLLCAMFGIPPEQAIALSLVKRAADLVLGVPGLLGWQMLEWERLAPIWSDGDGLPQKAAEPRPPDP